MNRNQRIVLIIGAIVLLIVILTAPEVSIYEGSYLEYDPGSRLAPIVDFRTAIIRMIGVVGATLFIWYALKDKHKN